MTTKISAKEIPSLDQFASKDKPKQSKAYVSKHFASLGLLGNGEEQTNFTKREIKLIKGRYKEKTIYVASKSLPKDNS